MVSVLCTVNKGDLPLNITWTLNTNSVNFLHGISAIQTNKRISQLSIESVQAGHAGEYTCIASNNAGTSHQMIYLYINDT